VFFHLDNKLFKLSYFSGVFLRHLNCIRRKFREPLGEIPCEKMARKKGVGGKVYVEPLMIFLRFVKNQLCVSMSLYGLVQTPKEYGKKFAGCAKKTLKCI
jgi:hypothetical protein